MYVSSTQMSQLRLHAFSHTVMRSHVFRTSIRRTRQDPVSLVETPKGTVYTLVFVPGTCRLASVKLSLE